MAYLAAVPAGTVANGGSPSVIAADETQMIGPEIGDYARRYHPDRVILVGAPGEVTLSGRKVEAIVAETAEEAACKLSKAFWSASATAVACREDDYESALVASALAARLRSPLLFAGKRGLTATTTAEMKRLRVREIIVVGLDAGPVLGTRWKVTALRGAREVAAWMRKRGLKVRYLAAVNPMDRTHAVIKKLSLAGALLAAGRQGLVVPLTYDVGWKVPIEDAPLQGDLPAGVPKSSAPAKAGTIALDGKEYRFILTGEPQERNLRLSIDETGHGTFGSPLVSGDFGDLGGKRYAVSLGTRTRFGKTDVHLTWPTAEQLCGDLRAYYHALGAPPDNLCLVGFPDAIPQAIIGHGGVVEEQASDLPYGNADDDPFTEIGVGRIVAESAAFATLYASRVLTYRDLLSADWKNRACQAQWENTYRQLFENVGFDGHVQHNANDIPWVTPPSTGKPGVRAESFAQDSPLASCAALTHADHSWWRDLGGTFTWDADVLLAPTVVESGGCGTACLDREPNYRSVVARLFRKGAVAFCGASREAPAEEEPERQEFWNAVLARQSIGQAHKRALNSALLAVLDNKEDAGGAYRYCRAIRTQFGDPAFVMYVPGKPRTRPAHIELRGNTVVVYAPKEWWKVKIVVPGDWKAWVGKNLYVIRGAGTYALSDWCAEGYNLERTYVSAEFTSPRRVARIKQVESPAVPLGWRDTWYEDPNPDGTFTYRWAVRLVDFDQIHGRIVSTVDRLHYRITYE